MTLPRLSCVASLYALQNSMMLTPCWPSAGPIGGAGLAAPAWICSLMSPVTFFFGAMSGPSTLAVPTAQERGAGCGRRGATAERALTSKALEAGHEDLILLDLSDLVEVQGHRGLAFEDRNEHNQLRGFQLDLGNRG